MTFYVLFDHIAGRFRLVPMATAGCMAKVTWKVSG